jgi:hypothetical protein
MRILWEQVKVKGAFGGFFKKKIIFWDSIHVGYLNVQTSFCDYARTNK